MSRTLLGGALLALTMLVAARPAAAVGAAAGLQIDNTAQVNYTLGTATVTEPSNTVSIVPGFGSAIAFELRAFFPGVAGLTEDPVTGSLNAAVAQWLIGSGRAPDSYQAAQGTALDRAGRITVERDGDTIWVGGRCWTVVGGTVDL